MTAREIVLIEKNAIAERVTLMLHAIDTLDWNGVDASFADQVNVDYTSLFGGEAATIPAQQLLLTWRSLLPGFDATQHLIGPVISEISSSSARAETHVRGYHRVKGADGGDIWMVAGHYVFQLRKHEGAWRISALTLIAYYQEGNTQLPVIATARVKAGQLRRSQ